MILLAVLFRLREGCSWRALSIFAPYTTIYTRWKQWCEQGVWETILGCLADEARGQLWAIATRYEKLASRFLALVTLAAICDWLHF